MLGAAGGATAQRKAGYVERGPNGPAEPLRERACIRMHIVGFQGASKGAGMTQ
jgi:hypothetical protein